MLNAGAQSPLIHNVRLVNAGEQFIKASPDGAGGGVDNGIVEYGHARPAGSSDIGADERIGRKHTHGS